MPDAPARVTAGEARLGTRAADAIRAAIRLAGGREVCFTGTVDAEGTAAQLRVAAVRQWRAD